MIADNSAPAEAQAISAATPPPVTQVVSAVEPATGRDHRLAGLCRAARERFQAVTGAGLSPGPGGGARPQRFRLPGRGGLPPLSYLASGWPGGRRVLFVHGTPGDATDWMPFLRNAPQHQQRIAVDRPGFGESGPGAAVVGLSDQAQAIAPVLQAGPEPAVVVGSSYGGPVALRLAADYPDAVAGVLLVGAAADPGREKTHPLQRLAAIGAVSRMLPRALAHSNAELLALPAELAALGRKLGQIRAPVTVLHGLRDTLVPAENASWLIDRLVGAAQRRLLLVEGAGHFLHILASGLVESALARVLADADGQAGRSAKHAD